MRVFIMTVLVVSAALVLAGCFQVERVVTVKPDGSGTLEESLMVTKKSVAAMNSVLGGGSEEIPADFNLVKEEDLKAAAKSFGEGVSFVKSTRVSDAKYIGYRVTYAFKDINRIKIDKGPPKMEGNSGVVDDAHAALFTLTPGPVALLSLKGNMPKQKMELGRKEEMQPPAGEPNPQEIAMLKEMLDGMRFSFTLVIDGKIEESNATHRQGNKITLVDVDFSKLMDIPTKDLSRLNSLKDGDMDAAIAVLKDFPGVKVDMNDEVKVRFK